MPPNPASEKKTSDVEVTPEEASKLIRFALAELGVDNGFHDFEHLCRHLTRLRICPNVLPASGPVSGSGDQGADFESYAVSGSNKSRFFIEAKLDKLVFACSLEKNVKKKVLEDLQSAATLVPKPNRIYFFHNSPVKFSVRHKLQLSATQDYGLHLEIVDGPGIAELLSSADTAWIAKRYLSLPSEFIIPRTGSKSRWYDDLLHGENQINNDARFFDLKDAIRQATFDPDLIADIPALMKEIRVFRTYPDERIRRKAVYEEFVASLRGLADPHGYEIDVQVYMDEVPTLTHPFDLEDAGQLLMYVLGARRVENFQIRSDQVDKWHSALKARLDDLLAQTTHPPRICALLSCKASLFIGEALLGLNTSEMDPAEALQRATTKVFAVWNTLIKLSDKAPLFPIERIARYADTLLPFLSDDAGLVRITSKLDAVIERRSGRQARVHRYIDRAVAYFNNGNVLRALTGLHDAHAKAADSGEAVRLCRLLGKMYAKAGLSYAAKHYSFAAMFASLSLPEDDLRSVACMACGEAVAADYMVGSTVLQFLTAEMFVHLTNRFSMDAPQEIKEQEWMRIDYHLLLSTFWSKLISPRLHEELVKRSDAFGLGTILNEMQAVIKDSSLDCESIVKLRISTLAEQIGEPFSDVGGRCNAYWVQMQSEWIVSWPTVYEIHRFGESFCAHTQIILNELAEIELSIIPGSVKIKIEMSANGQFECKVEPNNQSVSIQLLVPVTKSSSAEEQSRAMSAVLLVLLRISAEPKDDFMAKIDPVMKRRLPQIINAYGAHGRFFDEFYGSTKYDEIYHIAAREQSVESVRPQMSASQLVVSGRHPRFNEADELDAVARRYARAADLARTIQHIKSQASFPDIVRALRKDGWLDWHILLAIANLRLNFLFGHLLSSDPRDRAGMELFKKKFAEPEDLNERSLPPSMITAQSFRDQLFGAKMTALAALGLENRQQTPNMTGVDAMLGRFGYWELDLPHPAFFD